MLFMKILFHKNALFNSCETAFKETSLINMVETDTLIIYFNHSLIIVPDTQQGVWKRENEEVQKV